MAHVPEEPVPSLPITSAVLLFLTTLALLITLLLHLCRVLKTPLTYILTHVLLFLSLLPTLYFITTLTGTLTPARWKGFEISGVVTTTIIRLTTWYALFHLSQLGFLGGVWWRGGIFLGIGITIGVGVLGGIVREAWSGLLEGMVGDLLLTGFSLRVLCDPEFRNAARGKAYISCWVLLGWLWIALGAAVAGFVVRSNGWMGWWMVCLMVEILAGCIVGVTPGVAAGWAGKYYVESGSGGDVESVVSRESDEYFPW